MSHRNCLSALQSAIAALLGTAMMAAVAAQPADPRTVPSAADPAKNPPLSSPSVLDAVQGNELLNLLERVGRECFPPAICVPTKGSRRVVPTALDLVVTPQQQQRLTSGPSAFGIRILACQLPEYRETEFCRKAAGRK